MKSIPENSQNKQEELKMIEDILRKTDLFEIKDLLLELIRDIDGLKLCFFSDLVEKSEDSIEDRQIESDISSISEVS